MFSKKKKKPLISPPTNFEHRVHTGFDKREGRYVGLPLQWASIVGNNQILKSTNRPLPLVDPSEITPTEILDLKTIVRGDHKSENRLSIHNKPTNGNGIVLPKTSNVARSNSLRSSSPPRLRRDHRTNANVPPSVPEEQILQYPSIRRDPSIGKPQVRENSPAERSLSNHEVPNPHVNGGIHDPYLGYPPREHVQISPSGSTVSSIQQQQAQQMVYTPMGGHAHSMGSHQNLPHTGYPPRPDQNQNVKAVAQPQINQSDTTPPSNISATAMSSSKPSHEQRLTHEQVLSRLLLNRYHRTII